MKYLILTCLVSSQVLGAYLGNTKDLLYDLGALDSQEYDEYDTDYISDVSDCEYEGYLTDSQDYNDNSEESDCESDSEYYVSDDFDWDFLNDFCSSNGKNCIEESYDDLDVEDIKMLVAKKRALDSAKRKKKNSQQVSVRALKNGQGYDKKYYKNQKRLNRYFKNYNKEQIRAEQKKADKQNEQDFDVINNDEIFEEVNSDTKGHKVIDNFRFQHKKMHEQHAR